MKIFHCYKVALAAIGAASLAVPVRSATLPSDHVVLKSAIAVDPQKNTVVLPLHKGTANGKTVYYVITDSSSKALASSLGVVYAPAISQGYTQQASGSPASLTFSGAPDFTPDRVYTPTAGGFPPAAAKAGAVADNSYSPFVKLPNGATLDSPIVATGDGPFDVTTHKNTADIVLAIDSTKKTVTLLMTSGFFNGARVEYLSTDSSDVGGAVTSRATYTKKLADSKPSSESPIYVLVNGQTGAGNPQAQGLSYLALNERLSQDAVLSNSSDFGSPLNVLATFPTGQSAQAYSPLWLAYAGVWSKGAIESHKNVRLTSTAQVYSLANKGEITSPDGKPFGPAGFVVNCPVIGFVDPVK